MLGFLPPYMILYSTGYSTCMNSSVHSSRGTVAEGIPLLGKGAGGVDDGCADELPGNGQVAGLMVGAQMAG
jgi:hypothetical protein